MNFLMIYSRHGRNDSDDFDTLDEAWKMMEGGQDIGEFWGIGVLDTNSKIAYVPDIAPIGAPENFMQDTMSKACKKLGIDLTGYEFQQRKFW